MLEQCRGHLADAMKDIDLLLTPSALGEAPAGLAVRAIPRSISCRRGPILLASRCLCLPDRPVCRSAFSSSVTETRITECWKRPRRFTGCSRNKRRANSASSAHLLAGKTPATSSALRAYA